MYKIGEFSTITQITVKALRYYHEQEILVPEDIDGDSGYRLYGEGQFERAEVIKLLRKMDFSINEIKEILDQYETFEDLTYYMEEKMEQIEKKISGMRKVQRDMNRYIGNREEMKNMNSYEICEKRYEDIAVISIRYKGRYDEVGEYIGKLYKAAKSSATGTPFNIYHDEEYKEIADIEVCVPVKKEIVAEGITYKIIPGEKVLSVIHVGPYETVGEAYKFIMDYMKENGLEGKGHVRETYLKGPGMIMKGNPNKYRTEVAIPIE